MATSSYSDHALVPAVMPHAQPYPTRIWQEAWAWLMLVPVLFITLSGWIATDTTPMAFRFTAMADESTGRKLTRLACSLLILFLVSMRFRAILEVGKKAKLLLLLPALALVSVLWSQNRGHALIDSLTLLLTTLFAIYLYQRYPGDRVLSILNFGAFIALFLSVLSVTLFPSVGIDPYHDHAWRAIFGQRNACALTCSLFLLIGLHTRAHGMVERLMRGAVIFLSVLFTFMTASRTGWFLAIFGILLTYGLRFVARIRSLERILFLMLLTIPTVLAGIYVFNNYTQILAALDKDPTMTQRTVIWAAVLPSIARHPFIGFGYSSFWQGLDGASMQAVLITGWVEGQAQQGFLDILLQLGLAGLIPVVVLFLRGFGQAASIVERKTLDLPSSWAIVLLPVLLVSNIGESTLLLPLNPSWFYALLAFLILGRADGSAEDH